MNTNECEKVCFNLLCKTPEIFFEIFITPIKAINKAKQKPKKYANYVEKFKLNVKPSH